MLYNIFKILIKRYKIKIYKNKEWNNNINFIKYNYRIYRKNIMKQ